jgi:hypothetical protein
LPLAFSLRYFSEIERLHLDFRNLRLLFIDYKNI